MRGRKPKPTALKLLMGNPGGRPVNEREPIAPQGVPDCPALLEGEALAEWERIIPQLQTMGILSTVHRATLVAYCLIWADLVDSVENIRKFGKVVKSPTGYAMPNPYVSIARQAREDLRKYAAEFGLTPSSQSRVQVPAEIHEHMGADPFAQIAAENAEELAMMPADEDEPAIQ